MTQLAETLDAIAAFVRRFVALSEPQADAVAVWVFHTHVFDAAQTTPYLSITSAEKRSGKSRLLEVIALLASKVLATAGASEAALFRAIEERCPTLLFDEVDAIFGPKATSNHEDLRALLNSGWRPGMPVLRCVGEGSRQRTEPFRVYCPKALAGIGKLPDTVADRSIPIRMKRRAPGERVDRFRRREAELDAEPLRRSCESIAEVVVDKLIEARPTIPSELDDRAQDGWEPLLAIAEFAGGEWPRRARNAALVLSAGKEPEEDTAGVRLLQDIRDVFEKIEGDRVSSERLVDALRRDEEAPWQEWHGHGLTQRSLAGLLRRFEIRSKVIRLADGTTPRGFLRESFEDSWTRYLPETPAPSATSATSAQPSRSEPFSKCNTEADVADCESGSNPHGYTDVADVADRNGKTGGRPLLGDEMYPLLIAEAGNKGYITEAEFSERSALHLLVSLGSNR